MLTRGARLHCSMVEWEPDESPSVVAAKALAIRPGHRETVMALCAVIESMPFKKRLFERLGQHSPELRTSVMVHDLKALCKKAAWNDEKWWM